MQQTYITIGEALEYLGLGRNGRKKLEQLIKDGVVEARASSSRPISWDSVIAYIERTAAR